MRNDIAQGPDATGIEPLEIEHQRLMEAVNETCAELANGGRESVLDGLGLLYVRISAHLALEERVIRERRPELVATYRTRCHAVLERIGAMMDAFYEGRCGACDQALSRCLLSWLEQHLQHGHRQFAPRPAAPAA